MTGQHETLETERLILRITTLQEAEEYAVARNFREVIDNDDGIEYPYTEEDAQATIVKLHDAVNSGRAFYRGIYVKETGEFIGDVYLINIQPVHRTAELGYWITPGQHRKGYATEASECMVQHGFLEMGLNRIWGMCYARNTASAKVLRKVGMVKEGTAREELYKNGVFEDVSHYAVLRLEWECKGGKTGDK